MARDDMPKRYSLEELIMAIDEPNRSICLAFLNAEFDRGRQAPGSTHNHQAWPGGYLDHIAETMNLAVIFYSGLASTGRLAQLEPDEQFSLGDVLLVLFLHDIEKPWSHVLKDGHPVRDENGRFAREPRLRTKVDRKAFAAAVIAEWGFVLSPNHLNALEYVEGIRDDQYTPGARLMGPMAALCHMCDTISARLLYDFPLADGADAWTGAVRIAELG